MENATIMSEEIQKTLSPKSKKMRSQRRTGINASVIAGSVLGERKTGNQLGGFNTIGTGAGDDTERGRSVLSHLLNEQQQKERLISED